MVAVQFQAAARAPVHPVRKRELLPVVTPAARLLPHKPRGGVAIYGCKSFSVGDGGYSTQRLGGRTQSDECPYNHVCRNSGHMESDVFTDSAATTHTSLGEDHGEVVLPERNVVAAMRRPVHLFLSHPCLRYRRADVIGSGQVAVGLVLTVMAISTQGLPIRENMLTSFTRWPDVMGGNLLGGLAQHATIMVPCNNSPGPRRALRENMLIGFSGQANQDKVPCNLRYRACVPRRRIAQFRETVKRDAN